MPPDGCITFIQESANYELDLRAGEVTCELWKGVGVLTAEVRFERPAPGGDMREAGGCQTRPHGMTVASATLRMLFPNAHRLLSFP